MCVCVCARVCLCVSECNGMRYVRALIKKKHVTPECECECVGVGYVRPPLKKREARYPRV